MDSHEGTYTKKFTAKVEASFPGIVELDKTAFYHLGGGQPADNGKIVWDGGEATVKDVRKKNRIRHFIDGDSPEIGTLIEGELDWERRYSHMRMHSSQHLVSAVVNEIHGSDTVVIRLVVVIRELISNHLVLIMNKWMKYKTW